MSATTPRITADRPDAVSTGGRISSPAPSSSGLRRRRHYPLCEEGVKIRSGAIGKEPPRLLIGSDAEFLAGVFAAARVEEDARWRALSLSTDFDGLPDFSVTPVARMLTSRRR
jgi:hypothetical protein